MELAQILAVSCLVLVHLGMKLSGKFRFVVRITLFVVALFIANSIAILSALVLVPVGKGMLINGILAYWARVLIPLLTGIHGEIVEGDEHLQQASPVIYVMNHQSTLDLLLLGYVIPSRSVFTAKKEIASIPIMGQVFVAGNNILIDRGNRTSAVEAMNKVGERMKKDNLSVMIFPEGTRSNQRDNTLLPFKKGAFHLAKQTGFPIVPIVASTYFPIYDEKSMKFEQGTFAIKVLPPILTNGPDVTVDGLIAQTHKAMEDALQSISSVPKDQYA